MPEVADEEEVFRGGVGFLFLNAGVDVGNHVNGNARDIFRNGVAVRVGDDPKPVRFAIDGDFPFLVGHRLGHGRGLRQQFRFAHFAEKHDVHRVNDDPRLRAEFFEQRQIILGVVPERDDRQIPAPAKELVVVDERAGVERSAGLHRQRIAGDDFNAEFLEIRRVFVGVLRIF